MSAVLIWKDDFIIPKRAADPKNPKKVSLKKNAIPRVQQVATDKLEVRLFICCLFVVLYDFSQLVWRRKSHPNTIVVIYLRNNGTITYNKQ